MKISLNQQNFFQVEDIFYLIAYQRKLSLGGGEINILFVLCTHTKKSARFAGTFSLHASRAARFARKFERA